MRGRGFFFNRSFPLTNSPCIGVSQSVSKEGSNWFLRLVRAHTRLEERQDFVAEAWVGAERSGTVQSWLHAKRPRTILMEGKSIFRSKMKVAKSCLPSYVFLSFLLSSHVHPPFLLWSSLVRVPFVAFPMIRASLSCLVVGAMEPHTQRVKITGTRVQEKCTR